MQYMCYFGMVEHDKLPVGLDFHSQASHAFLNQRLITTQDMPQSHLDRSVRQVYSMRAQKCLAGRQMAKRGQSCSIDLVHNTRDPSAALLDTVWLCLDPLTPARPKKIDGQPSDDSQVRDARSGSWKEDIYIIQGTWRRLPSSEKDNQQHCENLICGS